MRVLVENLSRKHIVKVNGAEVILHPEYFKTLTICRQRFVKTNGLAIVKSPDLLNLLRTHGVNSITISYHFDAHDAISTVPRTIVDEAVNIITESDMKLWFMTVINKDNYKDVNRMCAYAYKKGASCIYFVNILKTGNALAMEDKSLNDEQIYEFLEKIEAARNQYDMSDLIVARSGTFGKVKDVRNNFVCPAGHDIVAITPDEKIKPCVGMSGSEYEIGHIENNKIIIDKPLYHDGTKCLIHEISNRNVDFKHYLIQ